MRWAEGRSPRETQFPALSDKYFCQKKFVKLIVISRLLYNRISRYKNAFLVTYQGFRFFPFKPAILWRHFFDWWDIGTHILYVIILWRLLSAKDFPQMQYSQKRLVIDFYFQFFSSNLDFNSDPSQVFLYLVYLTNITFCDSKSGFSYPDRSCVGIRDFQAKSG